MTTIRIRNDKKQRTVHKARNQRTVDVTFAPGYILRDTHTDSPKRVRFGKTRGYYGRTYLTGEHGPFRSRTEAVRRTREEHARQTGSIGRRIDILLSESGDLPVRSTKRPLYLSDIICFVKLVRTNPHKRVRVYSSDGFVPNSYHYRCDIQYIEKAKDGGVFFGWAGARRPRGSGSTQIVQ